MLGLSLLHINIKLKHFSVVTYHSLIFFSFFKYCKDVLFDAVICRTAGQIVKNVFGSHRKLRYTTYDTAKTFFRTRTKFQLDAGMQSYMQRQSIS